MPTLIIRVMLTYHALFRIKVIEINSRNAFHRPFTLSFITAPLCNMEFVLNSKLYRTVIRLGCPLGSNVDIIDHLAKFLASGVTIHSRTYLPILR
jgi:hypothetical protein